MAEETTDPIISPELYQEVLERLTLRTVCLDQVEAVCERDAYKGSQVDVSLSSESEARQTEDDYFTFVTYSLCGQREDQTILRIDAKCRLVFDAPEPVPVGFFEVFRELNLRMTTMPYFRELVASLTGRMEIPTLTLPYAIYVASQDDDSAGGGLKPAGSKLEQRTRKRREKKQKSE